LKSINRGSLILFLSALRGGEEESFKEIIPGISIDLIIKERL